MHNMKQIISSICYKIPIYKFTLTSSPPFFNPINPVTTSHPTISNSILELQLQTPTIQNPSLPFRVFRGSITQPAPASPTHTAPSPPQTNAYTLRPCVAMMFRKIRRLGVILVVGC